MGESGFKGSLRFKIPVDEEIKTSLSVPKQLQPSIGEHMGGICGVVRMRDPLGSIKYDTRPHLWDKTRVSSKSP